LPRFGDSQTRRAGYLSGGEQGILVIGRVMMANPELRQFDEPSMGFTPLIAEKISLVTRRQRHSSASQKSGQRWIHESDWLLQD
jgi:branched-chain amino acid transport system ATP-binding protein